MLDLIEARDHYHLHLAHKTNVVATAIGRYLIRKGDYYDEHAPQPGDEAEAAKWGKPAGKRTLFNTVVRRRLHRAASVPQNSPASSD